MSNMSYTALVSIQEKQLNDENGKPIKGVLLVELSKIPVRSFSVVGGASRTIDLDSTDDISISSEMEQARTYKNLTLFVPPTLDLTAAKLFTLKSPYTKFFTLFFQVDVFSGGKRTHTLILESSHAWLFKQPTPAANNLLMLEVRYNEIHLLHGKLSEKDRSFVHEEM